ncbi:MAG: hypothetical protein K0R26_810 [Bacteroidota bacterium]|jgi:hypothetical protein|nr:hypothetical protein [Bacteroidota bacterium]
MRKPNRLRILFVLYLGIFALPAFSQYNSEFINFEKMGRSVSLNAEYELGSNGIYNSFLNKFIYGGYIDKKTKDASNNSMRNLNVMGANMNYDISTFFGRSPKYSYLVGFKDQRIFNSSFTKDFYQLVFYGNQPYKNETKNLSGSSINSLRFQELKLGFIWHKIDTTAKVGVSISILKGQQLFYIRAKEGSSLYTNSDGTELVFNSNFNMALSDTNNRKNPFAYTGLGASADIFFETPYKSKIGKESVLTVNANNIGFLHWFDNSVQYSSDSTFKFEGYQIDNLLDLKDSTLAAINRDSIIKNTTNAHQESFNVNIPTNLLIVNRIRFTDKFVCGTGFRYLFNSNFKPYFFMEAEYMLSPKISGSLHVGYGGYSKLNLGVAFSYVSSSWFFKIGSNSLQGYISPANTYGQGAFLSIARKFKR